MNLATKNGYIQSSVNFVEILSQIPTWIHSALFAMVFKGFPLGYSTWYQVLFTCLAGVPSDPSRY